MAHGSCHHCGCARSECECEERAKKVQIKELTTSRREGDDLMSFEELADVSAALIRRLQA